MLSKLMKSAIYRINVYEGVSPALLATMSLANDIKGSTQQELAVSLYKGKLIETDAQLQAWKYVDRKHFTKAANPYVNRPHSISKGESMTDVFTHSLIVSNLHTHLNLNSKILDIGTGHGYLSFLISKILENKKLSSFQITGIDINEEAIKKCKQIQTNHFPQLKGINFYCSDLSSYLIQNKFHKFDAIIGGYFIDEKMSAKLVEHLTEKGVGIWPRLSQTGHGQALYKIKSDKSKTYLIQTLFSMPVVRTSVDKYFVEAGDEVQKTQPKINQSLNQQKILQQAKNFKKQEQQRLKGQLKILLQKYRKDEGRLLSLQEMKSNQQIRQKMEQLQKLSKTKVKSKK